LPLPVTLGGGTLAGSHWSIDGSHGTIILGQTVVLAGGSSSLAAHHWGDVVVAGGTTGAGDLTLRTDPAVTMQVNGPLAHVGRTTVAAGAAVHLNVPLALSGELRVDGRTFVNADLDARGVRSHSEIGDGASTGTIVLAPGTKFTVDHVRLGTLSLGAGARIDVRANGGTVGTSRTRSLSLGGTPDAPLARFDLADNAMVIDYGPGPSLLDATRRLIVAARNGGAWDGNGLGSALADDSRFGIGYGESVDVLPPTATQFVGQVIAFQAVLVRYTRYGDANIDGQVNLQDFNRLATAFGTTGTALWSQGDFNYDGNVNLQDFNRLASNFGLNASGPGVTPADWSALAAAVPEPAAAVPGALVLCGLLRRRRHSR
jgi:hypothetical protein